MENIVRKEEIAYNKQFLLSSQCYPAYMVLIFHFKCTLECHLQFVNLNQSKILSSGNGLKKDVCDERLTHSHTMTPFMGLGKKPFENMVRKGKIACTSNFTCSHNVAYSIKGRNYHFCYI